MNFGPGKLYIQRGTDGALELIGNCNGFSIDEDRGTVTVPPMPGPFTISMPMTEAAVRLWAMIFDPKFRARVKRFRAHMRAKLRGRNWRAVR